MNMPKRPMMKIDHHNIETIHSAQFTTDSNLYVHSLNWQPDYWVVVARFSAGFIWIYPASGRSGISFRLDKGSAILPLVGSSVLTIETVSATGFYDLYPVRNLDGFDLQA